MEGGGGGGGGGGWRWGGRMAPLSLTMNNNLGLQVTKADKRQASAHARHSLSQASICTHNHQDLVTAIDLQDQRSYSIELSMLLSSSLPGCQFYVLFSGALKRLLPWSVLQARAQPQVYPARLQCFKLQDTAGKQIVRQAGRQAGTQTGRQEGRKADRQANLINKIGPN